MGVSDVTVLLPYKRGCNQEWLKDAVDSIPFGTNIIRLENDGELADALNQGLRAAETEYVIRLDHDDLFDTDTIQTQLDAIWDVDVTYPRLVLVSEDLKRVGDMEADEFCANRLLIQNYIPGAGSLFRRDAALAAGGFRDLEALEDWDLWIRMWRNGATFKASPDSLYFYRQVAGSRNKMSAKVYQDLRDVITVEPELAATWYVQETVATTYWRALLPARYLPGQVVRHKPAFREVDDQVVMPNHRGAAIWQFPGHEYEQFSILMMQALNVPCLMEVDDNYLVRRRYGQKWTTGLPDRYKQQVPPSIAIHKRILGITDGVIASTEQLAKQYRKHTDKPVFVCENQVDPADWPEPDPSDGVFRVGWAGSASHLDDVKLVTRALEWCSRQPDVEVVVFGFLPPQFVKAGFRFRHVPWTSDISAYRKLQGMIDLGVAPVIDGAWASCRSDLKIMEYAMAGAATLASDAIPYRGWADGEYIRKASDAQGFLRVIREMVNDRTGTRQLAEAAREHVLAERTIAGNAWKWAEAIDTVTRGLVAA